MPDVGNIRVKLSERMWFYIGLGIIITSSLYCWIGIRRAYHKGETLPVQVSVIIWITDVTHFLLVFSASLTNIWPLPLNNIFGIVSGVVIGLIGFIFMLIGVIEFQSFKKMSGLDSSTLITTGIYRWSRNPQYTGWFFMLIGISFIGYSGLALLLTLALVVGIHLYTVKLEEPYLERIFGKKYGKYKLHTSRYVGIPKKKRKINYLI